ncbi:unnamed protein product, partial [Durusdinium trenchii]
ERPLHWAAWSGHRHVVERLLAAGAVVEAQDKKCGCRPLHWAAFEGHLPVWRDSLRRRPRSKPRTTEALGSPVGSNWSGRVRWKK